MPLHDISRGDVFGPTTAVAVGEVAGSSRGTVIAASASANTKGSWLEVVSSLPSSADGFYLEIQALTLQRDFLLDIGTGAGGAEVVLVPDILYSSGTGPTGQADVYIPLPLAAGTRVAARCQASAGSANLAVVLQTVAGGLYSTMRLKRATNYGSNTADSGGTQVDPGAVAHTKGAWSQISASTTNPIKYAIVCVGNTANTTVGVFTQHLIDVGTGGAGAESVVLDDLQANSDVTADILGPPFFSRQLTIPSGTRLAGRSQCSNTDATDRLLDLAVVGFD